MGWRAAAALAVTLAASGCSTIGTGNDRGVVAADPPAGGETKMVGGLLSGAKAEGLGRGDIRKALAAEYQALEFGQSGKPVRWSGDWSTRSGEVVPAQPYRVGSQDCRQYTHALTVGGTTRTERGTACRNADGSWATLT